MELLSLVLSIPVLFCFYFEFGPCWFARHVFHLAQRSTCMLFLMVYIFLLSLNCSVSLEPSFLFGLNTPLFIESSKEKPHTRRNRCGTTEWAKLFSICARVQNKFNFSKLLGIFMYVLLTRKMYSLIAILQFGQQCIPNDSLHIVISSVLHLIISNIFNLLVSFLYIYNKFCFIVKSKFNNPESIWME